MKNIKENGDPNISTILVGNKIDLYSERVVSKEKGEEMAQNYSLSYLETSAKNDANVFDVFVNLTKQILEKKGQGIGVANGDGARSVFSLGGGKKSAKKCC